MTLKSRLLKDRYARFWSKVDVKKQNQCWEWRAAKTPNGYGIFGIDNRSTLAHTIAFKYAHSSIPKGLWIDHVCMNKLCVNPSHLRAVTPAISATENTNGTAAKNAKKTHCVNGHHFSLKNTKLVMRKGRPERKCRICIKANNDRSNRKLAILTRTLDGMEK